MGVGWGHPCGPGGIRNSKRGLVSVCRVCACDDAWYQHGGLSLQPWGQETFEASMTGFSVVTGMLTRFERGARPQCLPIRINKAANLGKYTLLSPLCLFWPSWLALPQNAQFQGPEGEMGMPAPPGKSTHSTLKGLACSPVVGSEPLGSWFLVRLADVWAALAPAPHPTPPASFCTRLGGEAVSVTAWVPHPLSSLSRTSCCRPWTVDLKVSTQQRQDRALSH